MPELGFQVNGAEPVYDPAMPPVALHLEISNRPASEAIHAGVLRSQVQIEAARRRYSEQEQQKLHDLFGEPERWGLTLRPMLWANVAVEVPKFTGATTIALDVPCKFDLKGRNQVFPGARGWRCATHAPIQRKRLLSVG